MSEPEYRINIIKLTIEFIVFPLSLTLVYIGHEIYEMYTLINKIEIHLHTVT